MKRIFCLFLTLVLLLSLAACGEKTESKYPKNDFANLLTTDFWSMDESALDAFLTEKGFAKVTDELGTHYLCTLFGKSAYTSTRFGEDGKLELISASYQRYNTQNAAELQRRLAELPEEEWSQYRIAETEDDFSAFLAKHTLNARQAMAGADAVLHETARLELHGQTEEELRTFFEASSGDVLAGINPTTRADQSLPGFARWSYYEQYYAFSNGTIGLFYAALTANRFEKDGPIGQYLQAGLTLCEPESTGSMGIPLLDFNAIADPWASYAPK